ncbi:hypothetical protein [Hyphomicrobium sp.]|jgi:hypothetical protein|uniref:hypothetical protein n=1 Tax=Hyphomicrobium sp. TaxID=82 RepID=UPI002CE08876|nr:hypothetical protein [Hyphomicrobium sp.]HVZ03428.1 hypothetical protein [Hyphomicrobium sp.]
MRDHVPVVELNRPAILADNHQNIDGRRRGWIGTLTGQRVDIDVALGAKAPAYRAACYVLAKEKAIDLSFRNWTATGFRCHQIHREQPVVQ